MGRETILSFTIGRLRDLLVQELVYLQALRGPVDELAEKLTKMEELLEYAHIRRDKRTAEIIKLADHLTDSVETYVLRVMSKRVGLSERLLRPKVRLAIEKITTKIDDLLNSQIGVQFNVEDARRPYKVQDLSGFNEKDFVGREEDVDKLVSYLVDEDDEQFQVISIHGMGGLGKTTLARKVYKDKKVLRHFQCFAFVCVSEQCQSEDVLKHILQQLVPGKNDEITTMPMEDVIDWLHKVQRDRKCLIIMDDIWSIPDWESLKRGIPNEWTGSKVVLTTRMKNVADKGFCYSLKFLSEDECWELFEKKIFTGPDPLVKQRMEELGRKMIAWCRGNPLAVLVLRGTLVTKGTSREWERFYESRKWGGEQYEKFEGEVDDELLFSYTELPYPLKPCFLCLANFAEDEQISVGTLYRLWEAQGMILSKDREVGETMTDVAERYFDELVGRSMVEEIFEDVYPVTGRRVRSCRVHDLMRGLCFSIVKRENFLNFHDYRSHVRGDKLVLLNSSSLMNDLPTAPRQVFYFSQNQEFIIQDKKVENRDARSLIINDGCARNLSNLKKLNLLRVLIFDGTSIGKLEFTNELIHLRYLGFDLCNIRKLPSSLDNLTYLQTLDMQLLMADSYILNIPNVFLRNLKRLRHLFLPFHHNYKVTPKHSKLRFDGLLELETLENVESTKCEMKDIIQLTNLRRLEWMICISGEAYGEELKGIMNQLNLDLLQHSSLNIILDNPKFDMGKLPQICEEILHLVAIKGMRGKVCNLLSQFSNFGQLASLILLDVEFEKDPMPTLEKLLNLRNLFLLSGEVKGKEMVCSTMGFPQLRFLFLNCLKNWEKWRVEEGAMPNIFRIHIRECMELEMLPDGLKFITTLQVLVIEGMPEGFTKRLIGAVGEEGPEFYKIRHVIDLEISDSTTSKLVVGVMEELFSKT